MPQPAQGPNSQEAYMLCPAQGPNSQEANLPQPARGFSLQEAVTPQPHLSLPGDLHPDAGMPSSQVATVLSRISFRKTHP